MAICHQERQKNLLVRREDRRNLYVLLAIETVCSSGYLYGSSFFFFKNYNYDGAISSFGIC